MCFQYSRLQKIYAEHGVLESWLAPHIFVCSLTEVVFAKAMDQINIEPQKIPIPASYKINVEKD